MPKTEWWGNHPITPEHPEFEAQIRAVLGDKYSQALRDYKGTFVPTTDELNLKGFTRAPGDGPVPPRRLEQLRAFMLNPDQDISSPGVYGVGTKGARPSTWAHEYRHMAEFQKPGDEWKVRILDAHMAGSKKQWERAVDQWWGHLNSKWGGGISRRQAYKDLIHQLEKYNPENAEATGTENWKLWATDD